VTPTADPLALPHVAALLRALDQGDDGVLPVLADALEEASSDAACWLRLLGRIAADPRWHCRPGHAAAWPLLDDVWGLTIGGEGSDFTLVVLDSPRRTGAAVRARDLWVEMRRHDGRLWEYRETSYLYRPLSGGWRGYRGAALTQAPPVAEGAYLALAAALVEAQP
jgi:hypothetical protein